jgi:two-component sensor histidine kinase
VLILHELSTNAAKHGVPVRVRWPSWGDVVACGGWATHPGLDGEQRPDPRTHPTPETFGMSIINRMVGGLIPVLAEADSRGDSRISWILIRHGEQEVRHVGSDWSSGRF